MFTPKPGENMEGQTNIIIAKFQLPHTAGILFNKLLEKNSLKMNQLVKQMVLHCLEEAGAKEMVQTAARKHFKKGGKK